MVDCSSRQINLRVEIIGMCFFRMSDKCINHVFFNTTFFTYIFVGRAFILWKTREAMSPYFLTCKRRVLGDSIMKAVSRKDGIKHPWTKKILCRMNGLWKDSAGQCLYFHYSFHWGWRIYSITKMGDWTLTIFYGNQTYVIFCFCIFGCLETTILSAGPIRSLMENSVVNQ